MRALSKSRQPRYPTTEPVIAPPTVTTVTVTPDQAAGHVLKLLRWCNSAADLKWGQW